MFFNVTSRSLLATLFSMVASTELFAQQVSRSDLPPPNQTRPPHIQKLIDEGDLHQSEKDFQKARAKYLLAHEKAQEINDKLEKESLTVETVIKAARAAANLPYDKKQLDDTKKLLATAAKHGTPRERAQIELFSADLAVRQGEPAIAIKLLHDLDWDQFDQSQQPFLKYNLGRAYDLNGQDAEAFRRYGDALKMSPQFSQAAERATESAWKLIQKNPSSTRATSIQLSKLGLANRSLKLALTTLSKPGTESEHKAALVLLFQSWAATYQGPEEFLKSDSFRSFAGLQGRNEQSTATAAVQTLVSGQLELDQQNPWKIPPQIQWFAQQNRDVRSACSAFAISVGKWLIADARMEPLATQALVRFMVAWGIDSENFDAAIEAARVLTLDFAGISPELVEQIVKRVFERKESLYYSARGQHEWNQLEAFHTFLGMVYEKQGIWGDEDEVRSAIFQWQHALNAHAEVQKLEPETPESPGLHEHLAKAWLGVGKKDLAFDELILASEGFLKQEDYVAVRNLLKQADELGVKPIPNLNLPAKNFDDLCSQTSENQ